MSIKKVANATNKWKVEVSARVDGKPYPIKRKATVRGTKAEANIKEAELLREIKAEGQGSLTVGGVVSTYQVDNLSDAIKLYKEKLKAEGKLSKSHERKFAWVGRELGHLPIDGIAETFEEWRRNFMAIPTAKGKRRAAGTINAPTNIVKAVMNHLVGLEIIDKNPIGKLRFPKLKQEPRRVYLKEEERKRLFDVIVQERAYLLPIINYMIKVPCRVSELIMAKKEQLRDNIIYIPTSKNGDPIHKPIPLDMLTYFRGIPEDCPYLFFRKSGSKYRPITCISKAWDHCRKLAGFPDLHIHDLRHIAATDMAIAGVPEREIMDIAGWRQNMLSVYYTGDSLRSAQRIMARQKDAA